MCVLETKLRLLIADCLEFFCRMKTKGCSGVRMQIKSWGGGGLD